MANNIWGMMQQVKFDDRVITIVKNFISRAQTTRTHTDEPSPQAPTGIFYTHSVREKIGDANFYPHCGTRFES